MDWIIFGDDWGRHVSTTQHLAARLGREDRILWVNSIGMRSPGRGDWRRVLQKVRAVLADGDAVRAHCLQPAPGRIVQPRVLPWHTLAPVRGINEVLLAPQLRRAIAGAGLKEPVLLLTYPVPILYAKFAFRKLVYLRLDDYRVLPGVDRRLVEQTEERVMREAAHIFVTGRALFPDEPAWRAKCHYLPQGVDTEHFAQVPLKPPGTKVLGFFGLLAEWLDYDLVEGVARACPEWTLEFVGPERYFPEALRRLPNIAVSPAVAYRDLPTRIAGWRAAWAPFRLNDLTEGVNPLKLREYLAAGLPTIATAIPEARSLAPTVRMARHAEEVRAFLEGVLLDDSEEARRNRRQAVAADGWGTRAEAIRKLVTA